MSADFIIRLAEQGVYIVLVVCGPLLLLSLAIGLVVSIFQAATQIQEQTLAFVPKIVAVLLGLVFFGPWMLSKTGVVRARYFQQSCFVYRLIGDGTSMDLFPAFLLVFVRAASVFRGDAVGFPTGPCRLRIKPDWRFCSAGCVFGDAQTGVGA